LNPFPPSVRALPPLRSIGTSRRVPPGEQGEAEAAAPAAAAEGDGAAHEDRAWEDEDQDEVDSDAEREEEWCGAAPSRAVERCEACTVGEAVSACGEGRITTTLSSTARSRLLCVAECRRRRILRRRNSRCRTTDVDFRSDLVSCLRCSSVRTISYGRERERV
jgi:hypothetical protein